MIDAAGGCEDALGEVEVTGEEDWQEFAEKAGEGKVFRTREQRTACSGTQSCEQQITEDRQGWARGGSRRERPARQSGT